MSQQNLGFFLRNSSDSSVDIAIRLQSVARSQQPKPAAILLDCMICVLKEGDSARGQLLCDEVGIRIGVMISEDRERSKPGFQSHEYSCARFGFPGGGSSAANGRR